MSPDKTQELYDKFSELYRGRTKPATESLVRFGFACDDGWFDLIAGLSRRIDDLAKAAGLSGDDYPEAMQVKEKFGGLRFYIGAVSQEIHDAIDKACERSLSVCEVCGGSGKQAKSGSWIRTLCENCED